MALHMVVLMDEHTNAIPLMALVLNIAEMGPNIVVSGGIQF